MTEQDREAQLTKAVERLTKENERLSNENAAMRLELISKLYSGAAKFQMKEDAVKELAASIQYPNVENYLKNSGWIEEIKNKRSDLGIWNKGKEQVLVPRDYGFADYARCIVAVASTVSIEEKRDCDYVLTDFRWKILESVLK